MVIPGNFNWFHFGWLKPSKPNFPGWGNLKFLKGTQGVPFSLNLNLSFWRHQNIPFGLALVKIGRGVRTFLVLFGFQFLTAQLEIKTDLKGTPISQELNFLIFLKEKAKGSGKNSRIFLPLENLRFLGWPYFGGRFKFPFSPFKFVVEFQGGIG